MFMNAIVEVCIIICIAKMTYSRCLSGFLETTQLFLAYDKFSASFILTIFLIVS